jgi:protein SCO1/2
MKSSSFVYECLTLAVIGFGLMGCTEAPVPQGNLPATPANAAAQTNERTFSVKGVLKEIKPDGKTAVIQHEEIPNYMPAMTMPLEVRNPNELAGLQAGDRISFRMVVTETDGWIDQVKKEGTNNVYQPPVVESFRAVRNVEPLNVGDAMPDYPFVNEEGEAIRLSQYKGQALAFSFIFTRCPFPLFCPKMNENFAEAYKKLTTTQGAPTNWHLLSISFDPAFDTPAVLKNYARRYKYDPKHWNFVTGQIIDIDAITEQFGLYFAREGGGANFNHNLRTVVVDAAGRVQKIFIGNEWKPDELYEEMVKAARVPAG